MTKTHVLDEIRRTAAANHGQALGRRRFETETGIRQADWSRFWARWSEAVREAGLSPNRLTVRYDDATLLDCYIKLARELSRLPAKSDLKLKGYNDPSFPGETAFRRFKSKDQLVKRVIDYCRGKPGYDDILGICDRCRSPTQRQSEDEATAEDIEFGYVYLTRWSRYYKLGRTNSAGRRQRELTLQLPERTTTVHTIKTDDPNGIEAYWHRRFGTKRRNGEWFQLDAADVRAFKRRRFM
jgi:hypothetical protein